MRTPAKHKNKFVLILVPLILLLIGGYFCYAYFSHTYWPFNSVSSSPSYENDDATPGTVRTTEDDAGSQNAKKRAQAKAENPSTPSKKIDVTVASAEMVNDNLEVRAFTDSIIESGECTVTASNGSSTKTATSPAFIDASSTICEPLHIKATSLSSGPWDITVEIKTASSDGQSSIVKVDVS